MEDHGVVIGNQVSTATFKTSPENDFKHTFYEFLKSKGLNDNSIAAIYGNMFQESSGKIDADNGNHKGLFQ